MIVVPKAKSPLPSPCFSISIKANMLKWILDLKCALILESDFFARKFTHPICLVLLLQVVGIYHQRPNIGDYTGDQNLVDI